MNETKKIKAIFFDNDGLLVNTEPVYLQATQEILANIGVEMPKDWYIKENLGKGHSSFLLAEEKGISEDRILALRRERDERYGELLKDGVQMLDGVPEVLELLQGKFVMGVVTSSRKHHFEIILEKTGLRKYFSFFITADDVKKHKPDPEPYLTALKLTGQLKENCLALEDSYRGVQAAKAAGLTCFAIPDALTSAHDFSIADKVLGSIREVPDLVF